MSDNSSYNKEERNMSIFVDYCFYIPQIYFLGDSILRRMLEYIYSQENRLDGTYNFIIIMKIVNNSRTF